MNYTTIWDDENKHKLKDALTKEVNGMFNASSPEIDSLRAMVPDEVDKTINNGVAEVYVAELAFGEHRGALCRGCDGECCRHCDPIGLTFQDAQRLAKYLGISLKNFIKKYLNHHHPREKSTTIYAFKQTKPCVFLNEHGKCQVYDARPGVCENYPLMTSDGNVGINIVDPYCRIRFNAAAFQCSVSIMAKLMEQKFPEYTEAMHTVADSCFPTQHELDAMSQPERIAAIAAGNKKFSALAFGKT